MKPEIFVNPKKHAYKLYLSHIDAECRSSGGDVGRAICTCPRGHFGNPQTFCRRGECSGTA